MDQTKISLDYLLLLLYYTRSCVYFYNFFVILSQSLLTERYSEMPDLVVRHMRNTIKTKFFPNFYLDLSDQFYLIIRAMFIFFVTGKPYTTVKISFNFYCITFGSPF